MRLKLELGVLITVIPMGRWYMNNIGILSFKLGGPGFKPQ